MILKWKTIGKQHTEHLISVFKKLYDMEEDWDGELYCRISLNWIYNEWYVDISMPTYIHKKTHQIQT